MSKLGVFVRLYTSKVYFAVKRSFNLVVFTIEISARRCQACRKMFRCPLLTKVVSYGSLLGIAPFSAPGASNGTVKHSGRRWVVPGCAPENLVTAFCGVQPGARGTIGFVTPSLTP